MARKRSNGTELAVFKGREARLNRAIFEVLSLREQMTIYDIYKELVKQRAMKRVRYASINKRVRILELSGFIFKVSVRETKAGFDSAIYELTKKTYLAIALWAINFDQLLMKVSEDSAETILASLLYATMSEPLKGQH